MLHTSSYDILVNKEYPLNCTYTPCDLVFLKIPFAPSYEKPVSGDVKESLLSGQLGKYFLRRKAAEAVYHLFQRALEQDIDLYGVSGYRSYERQEQIFKESLKKNGLAYTNQFIALPGCSEHQTGLALDVSAACVGYELEQSFSHTKEAHWLFQYAPLYGFILRYPKNKEAITGIAYEPWHIRYVTKPLAFYLTKTKMTLEEYHKLSFSP